MANKEIFNNKRAQILWDPEKRKLSFGWYANEVTEFEMLILNKIFDIKEEEE